MVKRGSYGSQNGVDKPARKQGGVGKGDDAEFRGYINLALSDAEKQALDGWLSEGGFTPVFDDAVADGINFAVRRDPRSEGFLASGTQRNPESPNAGLCVTARARSAQRALERVVYSVAILSRTERWEDTQPLADPDRW